MDIPTDIAAMQAGLTPDAIAFADHETGRTFTFGEMNERACCLSALLIERGLRAGDRMAVLCLNHPDFFVLLFAAQKTGILLVPLNWRQPPGELVPILKASGASLIFHDTAFAETAMGLGEDCGVPSLPIGADAKADSRLDDLLEGFSPGMAPDATARATAPWYLLYTSGTTGLPKAVIQTAQMAHANMVNYCRPAGLSIGETSINYLPLFHTAGINLPTLPVYMNGGRSAVLRKFDADTVLDLIGSGAVTSFFGVPAVYQAMALSPKIGETDFSQVRSLCCGGAPVPGHLLDEFQALGVTICNGMGMTETGPTVFLMDKAAAVQKIGSIGKPQPMTEVRLVDAGGRTLLGAAEGEAQFRGANVTPGYMDDAAATAAAFTEDGWLRSGDIARRDAHGYFYIVDRIKDMYISGGENVYPAEVERVLAKHPAILEATVIGVPDETWGEVGHACVLLRPGETLDPATLALWCRPHLAAYKIPKSFESVSDLPRTAAGKVRKNVLKRDYLKMHPAEKIQPMSVTAEAPGGATFTWTPTQSDFDAFARLSGDDNPIHVDPDFSARTRFGRTVAHGMLLYSKAFAFLDKLYPGRAHLVQTLMFPNPVYAEEELIFTFSKNPEQANQIVIELARTRDGAVALSATCDLAGER